MSFQLTGSASYDEANLVYVLTPSQASKTGSMIATGVAPCLNYKSQFDILLNTPTGTGTDKMQLFICQMDAEASVEIGIHHNATAKNMTMSLSKVEEDASGNFVQSIKYVDNVDVTNIITYGQTFNVKFNQCYGEYEAYVNDQLILKGSSGEVAYGIETGHFEVVAKTTTNVYGRQVLVNYGVNPIFTVTTDLDVFGTASAVDWRGIQARHVEGLYWSNVNPPGSNMMTTGSVGICTNPQHQLHVVGAVKADQYIGVQYTDIIGVPTIPSAQVNADWNATSGIAQILNKPSLQQAQAGDSIPIGTVTAFYGTTVSDQSWLICDGATYTRADYIELANFLGVISTATTFQVPDLRGKFLRGKVTDVPIGTTQGSSTATLASSNLPNHTHTGATTSDGTHTHAVSDPGR